MKTFFKEILDYGYFFNQKLADVFIENADKLSDKSINLFNHILNSHEIWNSRIEGIPTTLGVWEIRSAQEYKSIAKANHERSLLILEKFDLQKTVEYKNTSGQTFTNNVRDILFHINDHTTYHRAQIATEFRQSGIEPLPAFYIAYTRIKNK